MTEPIFFTKQLIRDERGYLIYALVPTPECEEEFKRIKVGKVGEWIPKFWRNIKFHRKFFALLKLVFTHQNEFFTQENLRKALLIGMGYCDSFVTPDPNGVLHIHHEADSMSFAKMDEAKFARFWHLSVDFLLIHWLPGVDREEIVRQVEAMVVDPTIPEKRG